MHLNRKHAQHYIGRNPHCLLTDWPLLSYYTGKHCIIKFMKSCLLSSTRWLISLGVNSHGMSSSMLFLTGPVWAASPHWLSPYQRMFKSRVRCVTLRLWGVWEPLAFWWHRPCLVWGSPPWALKGFLVFGTFLIWRALLKFNQSLCHSLSWHIIFSPVTLT